MMSEYFHIPDEILYFDCAGRSPLPSVVEQVGHEAVSWKTQPWKPLPNYSLDIHQKFAKLIHAESPDCIAIAPSTAFGMTLAAENILRSGILGPDKYILVMHGEMESSVYPWQSVCQRTGAILHVIPPPDDNTSWTTAIKTTIDSLPHNSIAVIILTCVHWCSGRSIDPIEISNHIKGFSQNSKSNPYILIDGTQSIGIEPFFVQEIQADFVTCSVHKWLLSPYGCSLMYLHPKHHDTWQALDQHDRNRLGNDEPEWVEISGMHSSVNPVYPTTFQWGARCISAGGRPNPILLPMVSAGLDMILNTLHGPETILSHVSILTELFLQLIETDAGCISPAIEQAHYSPLGILVIPKHLRSKHIIGLSFHPSLSLSPTQICQRLAEVGIKVSVRQSYLRISPYIYNSTEQVKQLYDQLRHIIQSGGKTQLDNPIALPYHPKMKILVIGGSAWLGQYVFRELRHDCPSLSNYEIHVTYYSNRPHFVPSHHAHRINLLDPNSYQEGFERIDDLISFLQPKVILHLAAQSSLVKCDQDPDNAARLNCPIEVIEAIHKYVPDSLFVYSSTDLVYDGTTPPFHPSPPSTLPIPSTTYGKTKLQFESKVITLSHGLILRLSNMIGGGYVYESSSPSSSSGGGSGGTTSSNMKFLQWLQKNYLLKNKILLKFDELRSFISVKDVAFLFQRIVDQYLTGTLSSSHECWNQRIYNVGGPIGLSRLELAKILCISQNCEFYIENTSDENESKDQHGRSRWIVSSVASESLRSVNSQGTIPPKDVTMDITLTESHFGIKCHDLRDIMPVILAEM